jgi:hypothetical protein
MDYKYKTIKVHDNDSLNELNKHYSEGWEFINSVAQYSTISAGGGYGSYESKHGSVYFTIRIKI